MCGGSPLFCCGFIFCGCLFVLMSGRLHRVAFFNYSRSPLSEPECVFLCLVYCQLHVGEIHRRDEYCNTRSPLSEPDVLLFWHNDFSFHVGEITQERSNN